MEFSIEELNEILMDLYPDISSNEYHTPVGSQSSSSTIKDEASTPDEPPPPPPPPPTNATTDREYCLIIFNNRSWSQRLRPRIFGVRLYL